VETQRTDLLNTYNLLALQLFRAATALRIVRIDFTVRPSLPIEAHEKGMEKFVPAFEALYNS
jgi:hypothetical protein